MKGTLAKLNYLSLLFLTSIYFKGDSAKVKYSPKKHKLKPALTYVEPNPRTGAVAPICTGKDILPPKILEISETYASNCTIITKASIFLAERLSLFKSSVWKDFEKLTIPLSTWDLVGFAGIDNRNAPWFKCNLDFYRTKYVVSPFNNLRQTLIFRVFLNVVGAENLENAVRGPQAIDKTQLQKAIAAYKRLNSKLAGESGVYVLYRPPQFIHVENVKGIAMREGDLSRNFGKWEIVTDSKEKAIQIVEALLPCFTSGKLSLLKFDLVPMSSTLGNVFRVIVYGLNRDPLIRDTLHKITDKKLLWVYERQTYEGMILANALYDNFIETVFLEKDAKLKTSAMEALLAKAEDKAFMRSLGLSDFQILVLLNALFLHERKDITDPATYTAHDFLKDPWITWRLLQVALRPENRQRFKLTLKEIRKRTAAFKD